MGYLKYDGKRYGIKLRRSFLSSLIANLPIINLLYTIKIEIHVVSVTDGGAPMYGHFACFRIFKNQKDILFNFIPRETMCNVYKYADKIVSKDESVHIAAAWARHVLYTGGEEVQASFVREDIS